MKKPVNRRFIAGAVCPACQKMDKLVMYREEGRLVRTCVCCGFEESLDTGTAPSNNASQTTIVTDRQN